MPLMHGRMQTNQPYIWWCNAFNIRDLCNRFGIIKVWTNSTVFRIPIPSDGVNTFSTMQIDGKGSREIHNNHNILTIALTPCSTGRLQS